MQWWIVIVVLVAAKSSQARRFYPYPHKHEESSPAPYTQDNTLNAVVVDEKTGIRYNPYSKHHPGRHVCVSRSNSTYPIKTKQVFCKPTYKKYMVKCGNQWCAGVRLVYEKHHKDVITNTNSNEVSYSCCPGWTQVTTWSHGCNKPVCSPPCWNGGSCVKPNVCNCPPGFAGTYCETSVRTYNYPSCAAPCQNGGTCNPEGLCLCMPGFEGAQCENDVDECKEFKPCDQICYNTPGSYSCECKENFVLQKDGQSCRKEDDGGTTFEAKDLEFEMLDKRLLKLEKMMNKSNQNQVTKGDLRVIYRDINNIGTNIKDLQSKMNNMEQYKRDIEDVSVKLKQMEEKERSVRSAEINELKPSPTKVFKKCCHKQFRICENPNDCNRN